MPIRLIPTTESRDNLRSFFAALERLPLRLATDIFDVGLGAFTAEVNYQFDVEGAPPWPPLAKRTVDERAWLAAYGLPYGRSHPILYREGFLRRSLTEPGWGPTTVFVMHPSVGGPHPIHIRGGNVLTYSSSGPGNYAMGFATLDERFRVLSKRRPMVPKGYRRHFLSRRITQDVLAFMRRVLPRELPHD